jgi:hypothetical protein
VSINLKGTNAYLGIARPKGCPERPELKAICSKLNTSSDAMVIHGEFRTLLTVILNEGFLLFFYKNRICLFGVLVLHDRRSSWQDTQWLWATTGAEQTLPGKHSNHAVGKRYFICGAKTQIEIEIGGSN